MNWSTFFTRLGSAIVFSILMMVGLLGNKMLFYCLATVIGLLCMHDFIQLCLRIQPAAWFKIIMLPLLFVLLIGYVWLFYYRGYLGESVVIGIGVATISFSLLLSYLLPKAKMIHAGISALSFLYIMLPIIAFLGLRDISNLIPLALVLLIWINDTMAYLVGSFIGRTPFNSISPKKTWEGTIGGIILTMLAAFIWSRFSPFYTTVDWIVLALFAGIAGTAGDLFESKLKREAKVKDSGRLMPGHGGALDRFDSLLFALPFSFVYAWLFMPPLQVPIF